MVVSVPELSDGQRAVLSFLLAGFLILSPLWTAALANAVAPPVTHRYSAEAIEPAGDRLQPGEGALHPTEIAGIDCWRAHPDYDCGLDHLLRDGDRTVGAHLESPTTEFVVLDRLYRRVHDDSGDTTTLGLEPVAAETVLETIAIERSSLSDAASRVVETGSAATVGTVPEADHVVAVDDGYVVIVGTHLDGTTNFGGLVVALGFGLVIPGLLLVRVGQVNYDRAAGNWRD